MIHDQRIKALFHCLFGQVLPQEAELLYSTRIQMWFSSYSLKPTFLIITNDLRPWFTIVYLRWLCERRLSRCSKVNSINKIKQKQKQKKNVVKTERFHRNELFWIGNSMKEESSRKKRKWRENSKYQELLMLWLSFLVLPLAHPLTPDIRGSKAGIELNTHFTLNERYKLS